MPGEVTCPAALRLGFYSLQIETKPRRALLKPLTQHMAGRRDRAEQRRCCREADEPGRHSSRSPGPRARALTPSTAAGERGITLGVSGPPATCPVLACGWAGTVPPGSSSAPPAPASAGGTGGFSHSHFWQVGVKTHLHLRQRLLSLPGQSSSPQKLVQLPCRLSTQPPPSIIASGDQGHGKARGRFATASEGLKMQITMEGALQQPPASVRRDLERAHHILGA